MLTPVLKVLDLILLFNILLEEDIHISLAVLKEPE